MSRNATHMRSRRRPTSAPLSSPQERIERVVQAARQTLGMEMAYVADTRNGAQAYTAVNGDGASFGVRTGVAIPLDGTYCQAMLGGQLGNVVRDSIAEPVVADLEITETGGIGSYIGVPVVLPNGEVYGTFCCLSHAPNPELDAPAVAMMELLAQLVADQIEHERILDELHSKEVAQGTIRSLLASLELRDGYTGEHSDAVVDLAGAIGRHLGMSDHELKDLRSAAVLHDIGKLGIPDAVLHKPGPLTPEEWEQMRTHPVLGASLVASMGPIAHLAPVIRAEHERWDGQGYPDKLVGEQIPKAARIILIADAFHAMTSSRPYRPAMATQQAIEELRSNSGTQFWPDAVAAAIAILTARRRQPSFSDGGTVELTSAAA